MMEVVDTKKQINHLDLKSKSVEGKSKAQLRAERRAIQEAQRALKAQAKEKKLPEKKDCKREVKKEVTSKQAPIEKTSNETSDVTQSASLPDENVEISENMSKKSAKPYSRVAGLFNDLAQDEETESPLNSEMHPVIIKLGVKYKHRKVKGSNCRCAVMLFYLRRFIKDFESLNQEDFARSLESALQNAISYLNKIRRLSVTMENAWSHLNWQMSLVKNLGSDADIKKNLRDNLMTYYKLHIQLAGETISQKMQTWINHNDVILTFGHSLLVRKILFDAHEKGKKFRVVVVDSRPQLDGLAMLKILVRNKIECTYVLINSLGFIMSQVSLILLGAHSISSNGTVMARIGTAQVALMGKNLGVPVLVACEMNKCYDHSYTDSILHNDLGNGDELTKKIDDTKKSPLVNWRSKKMLNLLNLEYDVTPASFISAVVNEVTIVPCSSIPVILHIKPWEV